MMGRKNELACKRFVLEIMDDNCYLPKLGWFGDWYARVRNEIGMA